MILNINIKKNSYYVNDIKLDQSYNIRLKFIDHKCVRMYEDCAVSL